MNNLEQYKIKPEKIETRDGLMVVQEDYKQSTHVKNSIHYPLEKLKSAGHMYFSLEAILNVDKHLKKGCDKYVNIFIINLEKQVGKTYWMRERMNELTLRCQDSINKGKPVDDKFLWVFRNEENMKQRRAEVNSDPDYLFFIRGLTIYTKGTVVGVDKKGNAIYVDRNNPIGSVLGFDTMHNASGNQYSGYKEMFWDEYRSKTALSLKKANEEVSKFIVLLSNFQRNKLDVKFYLFGNNEPGADLIAEALGVQKRVPYYIDFPKGVMYLNTSKAFSGGVADDNVAKRFASDNVEMFDFLESNISMESDKGITEKIKFEKSMFWAYLMLGDKFFKISIYQENEWLIQDVQEVEWIRDPDALSFAYLTEDLVHSPRLVPLPEHMLVFFANLYRYNLLLFWQGSCKNNFSIIWKKILKQNNLYGV